MSLRLINFVLFVVVFAVSSCSTQIIPSQVQYSSYNEAENDIQIFSKYKVNKYDKNSMLVTETNKVPKSENDDPCGEINTTTDMVDCYSKELKKLDKEMNSVYSRVLSDLIHQQKDKKLDRNTKAFIKQEQGHLREAQAFWSNYRSANCQSELDSYGYGTWGNLAATLCELDLTKNRIEEIKRIYFPK